MVEQEGLGVNQSVPIVLPINENDKLSLDGVSALTLKYNGEPVAILRNPEFFAHRKEERCARQFGTVNQGHPYIKVWRFKSGEYWWGFREASVAMWF